MPRELPDDFYEMTIEDIQMLISSAKQRQERENRLMTLEMREKERNELLKNFERVSIRVRLPGGLSMQGVFGLRDTVRHISDAVYDCLLPSSPSFELCSFAFCLI